MRDTRPCSNPSTKKAKIEPGRFFVRLSLDASAMGECSSLMLQRLGDVPEMHLRELRNDPIKFFRIEDKNFAAPGTKQDRFRLRPSMAAMRAGGKIGDFSHG